MKIFFLFFFLSVHMMAISQKEIPLYTGTIPNSRNITDHEYTEKVGDGRLRVHNIATPTLTIFEAPKNKSTGTGVIICPGGGYSVVAITHEGFDVAKRFNEMGITAFILKYRIPTDSTMIDKT